MDYLILSTSTLRPMNQNDHRWSIKSLKISPFPFNIMFIWKLYFKSIVHFSTQYCKIILFVKKKIAHSILYSRYLRYVLGKIFFLWKRFRAYDFLGIIHDKVKNGSVKIEFHCATGTGPRRLNQKKDGERLRRTLFRCRRPDKEVTICKNDNIYLVGFLQISQIIFAIILTATITALLQLFTCNFQNKLLYLAFSVSFEIVSK